MRQHTPESLREALSYVPSEDRETWIAMGMAVKSELGEGGFDVWNEWSQGAGSYNAKDAKTQWRSFKEGGGITAGTLIFEAKQRGYKPNGHGKEISAEEWGRLRREAEERKKREAEQKAKDESAAAEEAVRIWKDAKPASSFPYLQRKDVKMNNGLRVGKWPQREKENCLLVPMRDGFGKLWGLQSYLPEHDADLERDRDYLIGCRKQGTYFSIYGKSGTVVLCEGLATALSINEATGFATVVCFDRGNLAPVGKAIREKFKSAQLVFAADNDCDGKRNWGVEAASTAALENGGLVAIPQLGGQKADFNDLYKAKGAEAVRAAIQAAAKPPQQEEQQEISKVSQEWPAPEKLPELPEVPPFDYQFLPGTLRAFVHDISERMQAPPEYAAVGAMVMAGSAIGRNLGIRPKQFDSWTVIPNLWGLVVGKSGLMKSPALAETLAPLKRMQALAFEKYEEDITEFRMREREAEIRKGAAEANARKVLAKNKDADVASLLRTDTDPDEPKPRRYIINDSSPEALCETLKDNPQGVLCERDELIGLLRSMDREGNQEARALYLTAADGDKPFTVDRIMRGAGRHIEALCVSIVGGIQPGVLAAYVRETQRSGAGDDGLLQRFALMVYPDITGEWKNVDRKPDSESREAMRSLIERLCTLTPETAGAEVDPYGGVPFVRFDSAAYALFVEWLSELERKLRHGDDHPAINSHLSKYRKLIPALALINHLCEGGSGPVSEAATSRALLFSDFLEAHARRVYSYASRPDFDAAKTILAKLRSGKLPIEFTARDVYRPGWSGLTTAEETAAAIRVLVDFKYLREVPPAAGETGRPSLTYRAHPSIKATSLKEAA